MSFSENLKLKVKKKANFTCCWCQDITNKVEIHHIIPQADDGPDTEDNAAPLCGNCHTLYGGNPDLRKEIRLRRDHWYEQCSMKQETIEQKSIMRSSLEISEPALILYRHRNPPYNAVKMLYVGSEIARDLEVKITYNDNNAEQQTKIVTDFFPESDTKMMWHYYKYDFLKPSQVVYFHLIKRKSTLDGKVKVLVSFVDSKTGQSVQAEQDFELEDF